MPVFNLNRGSTQPPAVIRTDGFIVSAYRKNGGSQDVAAAVAKIKSVLGGPSPTPYDIKQYIISSKDTELVSAAETPRGCLYGTSIRLMHPNSSE